MASGKKISKSEVRKEIAEIENVIENFNFELKQQAENFVNIDELSELGQ